MLPDFDKADEAVRFLQRDFVPDHEDTKILQNSITTKKELISKLHEKITQLYAEIDSLQSKKASLETQVNWAADLLSPQRRFPTEILGKIFIMAAYVEIREIPSPPEF
ncbi:hypothetical protein M422DRAFT_255992 [Sphaerobolus stellatus SS14]|uniref:Uncharacterized protein n=1 Tax=Sphaerobolus stellatus (strain SS14) TaxID=990650 RepID=A0A0C9VRY3_SPHS4|nr:hypothetical protein M422DRAFT_255992 [Sphaerobolus stellatus SS14]